MNRWQAAVIASEIPGPGVGGAMWLIVPGEVVAAVLEAGAEEILVVAGLISGARIASSY